MNSTIKTIIAVATLAVLTGSVEAKPQPKIGTVIVYRKWHLKAWAVSLPFYVNGKLLQ
jgi:hypothetical protein